MARGKLEEETRKEKKEENLGWNQYNKMQDKRVHEDNGRSQTVTRIPQSRVLCVSLFCPYNHFLLT